MALKNIFCGKTLLVYPLKMDKLKQCLYECLKQVILIINESGSHFRLSEPTQTALSI